MEHMPRAPELPSVRVAGDLRRRLESGEWPKDAPLPAVAELAKHYGVARATVAKALRILESESLIRIVPRWGTFRA
jgi:DNA-binding GntR family transcriptional regulator